MKKKIQQVYKHPLISGSIVIFSGTLFANFISFIFNIYMRRELTNIDYGTFATLTSLISLPGLAAGAVIPVVVNFAGTYYSIGKLDLVRGFYRFWLKIFFTISLALFLLFLLFLNQISDFFQIKNSTLLILTDFVIFLNILTILNQAFIQAKLSFRYLSFNSIFGTSLKLVLGFIAITLGYEILGAVGATLVSFFISYIITFYPLRELFHKKMKIPEVNLKEIFEYGIPAALVVLGVSSLITTDLLLVKHFFNPNDAGIYAGISLAARIIFFFSAPIATVMFPLIVQKLNKGENYINTFLLSLFFVLVPSISLTIFYYFFPQIILNVFKISANDQNINRILVLFSVLITLFSLVSLISNFYLSIKKTKIYIPVLTFAILQAMGIWLFHNSFVQVLNVSLINVFVLLLVLLLYYPYATKKKKYK